MSRDIYLSIETTGLDADTDRIVELVALEAEHQRLTGLQFHVLLNPVVPVYETMTEITGYDNAQLEGLPTFDEVAANFLKFVNQARVITFYAKREFAFIDAELARLGLAPLSQHVNALQDIKSITDKVNLNVRFSLENLAHLCDCHEPVQTCSQAWRDCYLRAQIFPKLADGGSYSSTRTVLNIEQLERAVAVHEGPRGTEYIEIDAIPEPWQSQFMDWLFAGASTGDEYIHRCHRHLWSEWLTQAPVRWPELAPAQLAERPFVWSELRLAMRQGYQRAHLHLAGKFTRYPDDLEREMRYQASLANYGVHEKTLHEAFLRGFRKVLSAHSCGDTSP